MGKRPAPRESERRFALLLNKAAVLFEGNVEAARKWLSSPCKGLAGRSPMEMAETEVGAREVEDLIGRLEHGVFG
ncbi:MAG: DUF2384 domain-containing protein [Planctomycetia bacterium]|nr:DUF2384 domain-containing protein [Planctomycetia bacterium]